MSLRSRSKWCQIATELPIYLVYEWENIYEIYNCFISVYLYLSLCNISGLANEYTLYTTCTYLTFTLYTSNLVELSPKWTVDNLLAKYISHFPHNQSISVFFKKGLRKLLINLLIKGEYTCPHQNNKGTHRGARDWAEDHQYTTTADTKNSACWIKNKQMNSFFQYLLRSGLNW